MPRTDTDAFAIGAAAFENVVTIRNFARDAVRPVVELFAKKDNLEGAVYALTFSSSNLFSSSR